ncbi:hypothetical protein ACSSS7_002555 [Eimeria intestinalis]
MGARAAGWLVLCFLWFALTDLLTSCIASGVPSLSEDPPGDGADGGASENALSAFGADEPDEAASEAASLDKPLSITRRGRGGSHSKTSKPTSRAPGFAGGENSPLMRGGFFYQDEEEEQEEEDIYDTEELEMVRMIRLSREEDKEKPAAWGGIGDAVNLHAPTQVIMWVLLAAVVYFIMRGATRGEEKQKSLELHKGVLKTTIESLVRGKKEKQRLRKQRDVMMRDRTVLLRETIGMQAELASMLGEIQQAGTVKHLIGEGASQKEGEDKDGDKESGASPPSETGYQVTGITVPGFESGPSDLNKELHELLFKQGDTEFQKNAINQLEAELSGKIGLQGRHQYGGMSGMEKERLSCAAVEWWFMSAADSLNGLGEEPGLHSSLKARTSEAGQDSEAPRARTRRERKVDLLGLASAMVRRKMSLESQLEDILEQTNHVAKAEAAAVQEIVLASTNLRQVVSNWHKNLKEEFERISGILNEQSDVSEDSLEAVRQAYHAAISTDVLLLKLLAFEGASCKVSSEDTEQAAESRLKLLQMMQQANQLVAENSKRCVELVDTGSMGQREQAALVGGLLSMIENSYRDTVRFLAHLQSQLLVYDLQKKKGIIQAAPLKEKAQTLAAQLKQTDRWLEQAMILFRDM